MSIKEQIITVTTIIVLCFSFTPGIGSCYDISIPVGTGISVFTIEYNSTLTEDNPFRGFVPFMGDYTEPSENYFPHSMEFFYVPLKDLMDDQDSYTFDTGLESNLEEISGRKHHAIFRVYLDYPGEPLGVPDFLLNGLLLHQYDEFGGGYSPDYTNETLISTLEDFIYELGVEYDGDPRIAFIQIGLLGHWGEWHTYPHEEWFPNETVQNRILYAFDDAFNKTHILLRYPTADSPELDMGFHDDSFAYSTIGEEDWYFYNQLVEAEAQDRWEQFPIGGEIRPEIQNTMWEIPTPEDVQDYEECVAQTHASWMIYYSIFADTYSEEEFERARTGALDLGYKFVISSVESVQGGENVSLSLVIENFGNAPIYYPLDLLVKIKGIHSNEYTLLDRIDNFNLMPSENETVYFEFRPSSLGLEDYEVFVSLESTMSEIPIFFANEGSEPDGSIIVLATDNWSNGSQSLPGFDSGLFIIGLVVVFAAIVVVLARKR